MTSTESSKESSPLFSFLSAPPLPSPGPPSSHARVLHVLLLSSRLCNSRDFPFASFLPPLPRPQSFFSDLRVLQASLLFSFSISQQPPSPLFFDNVGLTLFSSVQLASQARAAYEPCGSPFCYWIIPPPPSFKLSVLSLQLEVATPKCRNRA